MDVLLSIGTILLLVGLNAFFVASEFALVGARTRIYYLQNLAENGDRKARRVLQALDQLDATLSGAQVGITLTSLALGWTGALWLTPYIYAVFQFLPGAMSPMLAHAVAVLVVFSGLVFLHVVFGEIVPKSAAFVKPEGMSRWVVPPLLLFNQLFRPIIYLLQLIATRVLHLFSLDRPAYPTPVHAPEELLLLLSESREHGLVEDANAAMIAGVFDLSSTSVREAMTPRTDICAVERHWSLEQIIETVKEEGFSRLPVYENDLDHIVGILLAKDLLAYFDSPTPFHTDQVVREPIFTSPLTRVDALMQELRTLNAHMAIVIDEYGGTLGLITLEDLLEQIVGEINDEFDDDEEEDGIKAIADGHVSVPGDFAIQDLNERFDLHLSAGDYVTVAGLVLEALGHVPSEGQYVTVDGTTFHVTAMDRQRIERLEIILANRDPSSSDTSSTRSSQGY
jgi:CBS domain containing-hemolysin-like protein